MHALRSALNTGNYHKVVREFVRAQSSAPSQAYVLVLTACAQVGDAETASRLLQLAEQAGIKLPSEAGLLLLRAAAKGPQPMESLIRHLPTSEQLMSGDGASAAASALFVARTLLLLGGAERAVKAKAILDGMGHLGNDAQVDAVHRSLCILAAGTLRNSELLHQLLPPGKSPAGDAHHLACCIIALARCGNSRSMHGQIVRAQADLLGCLDSRILDQDLDLILAASELAFESCAQRCSVADASDLRKLGQHISGHLTSLHRAKLSDTLDVGFLSVAKAALKNGLLSSTQRRELHNTWILVAEGLRYRGGLRNPSTCALILDLHIQAAAFGLSSMQTATELFEHAKRDGLIPEPEVYHALMKGWASPLSNTTPAFRVDHVLRTFRAMQRAGYVPDADAHAHLFTAATPFPQDLATDVVTETNVDSASIRTTDLLELETRMLSAGIPHSESSASALILALVRSGLYEDAFQRLVDMRLAGLTRSTALYNSIFEAASCDARASAYVLTDLRFSMAREDPVYVRADARTCRALISCCAAIGDASAAMGVLRDLRTIQVPTKEDYAQVARILDAAGALADADRSTLQQWQHETVTIIVDSTVI
ncbi:hypothetical protein HDU87_008238 [Geranomyces variabilis]|uniref:Uncharacterized protein n=1 Tax=Geranomyces variabilis TaxID=109894 RepID=A0AAD5XJY6_9FUNG|nr:hypothetical protein HDU87_008238 [Geranomyces variabilis]